MIMRRTVSTAAWIIREMSVPIIDTHASWNAAIQERAYIERSPVTMGSREPT